MPLLRTKIWHWRYSRGRYETNISSIVDILLWYGADVDSPSQRGETAVWLAARMGSAASITMLYLRGANQHQCNTRGLTPLFIALLAADWKHLKAARTLLKLSPAKNPIVDFSQGTTALHDSHVACSYGNDITANEILENGAKVDFVDYQGRTPLHVVGQGWHYMHGMW